MFDKFSVAELVAMILPLFLLQLTLQIYCIVNIVKNGVKNLNKVFWIIVVCLNMTGAIVFLLFGKKAKYDQD